MRVSLPALGCAVLALACEEPVPKPLQPAPGARFAVVSTNYQGATAISLLDAEAEVSAHAWASPSIANPDLRTPLAEDVALPTISASSSRLTTIERSIGVITHFDLERGAVIGQLKVDENPDARASYDSNPQDVYFVHEGLAWVSRWAPNADPEAPEDLRGTDLLAFDPSEMRQLDQRIDLSGFDTTVTQQRIDDDGDPDGEVESTAYARPSRLAPAGVHLVVGLVRGTLSLAFSGFDFAEGMVAVVDPVAGEVTDALTLDGLANCGDVYPVPDAPTRVIVACIGDWRDLGPRTGLLLLEVDGTGSASVVERFALADHEGAAPSAQFVASLGGTRLVAVATGGTDARSREEAMPDALFLIDLASGEQTLLLESDGTFALGQPAFDSTRGLLLVPAAGSIEAPIFGLHRFRVEGDAPPTRDGFIEVAPGTTLAARAVHAL